MKRELRLLPALGLLLATLSLLVSACGGGGGATTFNLYGYVMSQSMGTPIVGARVMVGSQVATTGQDGRYSLAGLPVGSGTVQVTATANGYEANTQTLSVSGGGTRHLDFRLLPAPAGGSATVSGYMVLVGNAIWYTASQQSVAGKASVAGLPARPTFTPPRIARARHVIVRLPAGFQPLGEGGSFNGVFQAEATRQVVRELLSAIGRPDLKYRTHPLLEKIGQRVATIEAPADVPAEIFAARLLASGKVLDAWPASYAYPMASPMVYPTRRPNDPYYISYHGPGNPGTYNYYHYHLLGMEQTWAVQANAAGVRVAVIDTGVGYGHPDLQGNLLEGYDVVDNDRDPADPALSGPSHGTMVAGLVGAVTNNGVQVAGTAWQTGIVPLRAMTAEGGTEADIAEAILLAAGVNGNRQYRADVINLSLGGFAPIPNVVKSAIDQAINRGVIVVAAAGNVDPQTGDQTVTWPANYDPVIAVAAVKDDKGWATFSNYGPRVDVAAPGQSVWTTGFQSSNDFSPRRGDGTSFASPIVAGIVALMRQAGVPAWQATVDTILKRTAEDIDVLGRDDRTGYGLVNPYLAVLGANPANTWIGVVNQNGEPLSRAVHPAFGSTGWAYNIPAVQAGAGWVLAWLDLNDDGSLNDGDYLAKYPTGETPMTISAGQFITARLDAGIYSSTAPPATASPAEVQTLWKGLKKAIDQAGAR
ncbi:MAG TPA: S8 family serine peptidase [Firmicutes bacterium]|nr:S8 family serine peptidase [Bacillota bacterium]